MTEGQYSSGLRSDIHHHFEDNDFLSPEFSGYPAFFIRSFDHGSFDGREKFLFFLLWPVMEKISILSPQAVIKE